MGKRIDWELVVSDWTQPNARIAQDLGVTERAVQKARKRLGKPYYSKYYVPIEPNLNYPISKAEAIFDLVLHCHSIKHIHQPSIGQNYRADFFLPLNVRSVAFLDVFGLIENPESYQALLQSDGLYIEVTSFLTALGHSLDYRKVIRPPMKKGYAGELSKVYYQRFLKKEEYYVENDIPHRWVARPDNEFNEILRKLSKVCDIKLRTKESYSNILLDLKDQFALEPFSSYDYGLLIDSEDRDKIRNELRMLVYEGKLQEYPLGQDFIYAFPGFKWERSWRKTYSLLQRLKNIAPKRYPYPNYIIENIIGIYLNKYEYITSKDLANILGITPQKAKPKLDNLVKRGILRYSKRKFYAK